jgi:branched-chain amino acid transport system ATP-binding protein
MLTVRGLRAAYGDVQVLRGIDLDVAPGEIVALVGANGAGKSTLLRCISGLLGPVGGSIQFNGRSIAGLAPADIVRLGMAHVPEGRQIFSRLTVADNLMLGAYSALHRLTREDLAARINEVCEIFPALTPRLRDEASLLSGGQQQMLAIARGLMTRPSLLLLDEPSVGLAPVLVAEIFAVLRGLRSAGAGLLIVEQNARLSLAVADRGYVVETGRVALAGTGGDLAQTPEVVRRYLGMGTGSGGMNARGSSEVDALAARLRAVLGEDSPPAGAEPSRS